MFRPRHSGPTAAAISALCIATGCNSILGFDEGTLGGAPSGSTGGTGGGGSTSTATGGAGAQDPLGEPCQEPGQCLSGRCVDGYCCDGACDGTCEACSVAGSEGHCSPEPAGTDPSVDCDDGTCDGAGHCATGAHLWTQRFGDSANQAGEGAVADAEGGVWITSSCAGSFDLGGDVLSSLGGTDVCVARFDADGTHLHSDRFGSSGTEQVGALAADPWGGVVVTGAYTDPFSFGTALLPAPSGLSATFVATLAKNGQAVWSKRLEASTSLLLRSAAVSAAGETVLCGSFRGEVDFDGTPVTADGLYDGFLLKLDASGNHVASRVIGAAGTDRCQAVAVDSAGNIVVTGTFTAPFSLGGAPLTSVDGADLFVAKLDAGLGHLWSVAFGGSDEDHSTSLDVSSDDGIVVAGWFRGELEMGANGWTSAGIDDAFVAKLNAQGQLEWSQAYGDDQTQKAEMVLLDGHDNLLVLGTFRGSVDLGGGPLTADGADADVFVGKLSADGTHLWSRFLGGPALNLNASIFAALTADGTSFMTGGFQQTLDLGEPVTSAGSSDIFLASFGP